MKNSDPTEKRSNGHAPGTQPWRMRTVFIGVCMLAVVLTFTISRKHKELTRPPSEGSERSVLNRETSNRGQKLRPAIASPAQALTAEEAVSKRLTEFAGNRRGITRALALRHKIELPGEVERFFDAVAAGRWEEANSLFQSLDRMRRGEHEATDLRPIWPALLETYGVAEAAHDWPAQKLLDYGNAILASLRPEMIYIGGTDSGRFIPTFLNETADGERHVVLTQNAFADATYLDYVTFLYADRLTTITSEDSQRAFSEYIVDAQKRFEHDRQFPNEPGQLRPGEEVSVRDGRVQVSGQVAVMAINEKLLQTLMQKNPDATFAMEESFPFKSTYTDAAPLGPIMELRAGDSQNSFTAGRASESLAYWQETAQKLLGDPEASGSPETLKTYSHMAVAQGNLLAAHAFSSEAEQAYRISSQLWPANPEPVTGLAELLSRNGRGEESVQLLNNFLLHNPDQRSAVERLLPKPWPTASQASSGQP